MADPIVVTGGTGVLGRLVVDRLVSAGRRTRVISRRTAPSDRLERCTADLRTGQGVAEAIAGAAVVIHCATSLARMADAQLTRNLVDAARRAGSPHLVYVSIVGIDRIPLRYYRTKLAAERLIETSGLPYTIVRATQFHDLLRAAFAWAARSPVMPVPALRFQPIDASEVADRLAELARGEAMARVPDLAGPQIRAAEDLARAYLTASGRRRLVTSIRLPGRVYRGYRDGDHLAPDRAVGRITFEQYLAARPDLRGGSYREYQR